MRGGVAAGVAGQGSGRSAQFVGDPYTEGTNDSAITIRMRGATIGTTYLYSISSSGGGTPVTGTSTVAAANFDITSINITGLSPGTLTLSYKEDSVERATDTALLLPPFDFLLLEGGDYLLLEGGDRLALAA